MWERHTTGHLIVQHDVNTPVFIWFLHSASKHLRVTWSCRKFKVEPQYRYVPWKMSGIVYIIHIFGICCICYSKPQTDRNVFPWWNRWCFFPIVSRCPAFLILSVYMYTLIWISATDHLPIWMQIQATEAVGIGWNFHGQCVLARWCPRKSCHGVAALRNSMVGNRDAINNR